MMDLVVEVIWWVNWGFLLIQAHIRGYEVVWNEMGCRGLWF